MQPDVTGGPQVGRSARKLGVRVDSGGDIEPNSEGSVSPGVGGMSVAPSLPALPAHRVPKRLRNKRPGAIGNDGDRVWSHGQGSFADGEVAPHLRLRVDDPAHGLVEPDAPMPLDIYENALSATKGAWVIDE